MRTKQLRTAPLPGPPPGPRGTEPGQRGQSSPDDDPRASPAWAAFWAAQARAQTRERRPLLPLHAGHLSLLLAAGALDGLVGEDGDRHLVRGMVRKAAATTTEEDGRGRTVHRTRERHQLVVKLLFPDGTLRVLSAEPPAPELPPIPEPETAPDDTRAVPAVPAAPAAAPGAPLSPLTGRRRRALDLDAD